MADKELEKVSPRISTKLLEMQQPFLSFAYWQNRDLRYIDCNVAYAKLFEIDNPVRLFNKKNSELNFDCLIFEKGDHEVLLGKTIIRDIELYSKDRKPFPFVIVKKPLINMEGEVIGIFCEILERQLLQINKTPQVDISQFLFDLNKKVTGQKTNFGLTVEESAEEIVNYLEKIIASMPNNVYWLDRNCVLLGGNNNLAKMFGLASHKELMGMTYEQMTKLANWTEGQGEIFKQAELEVMRTGRPQLNKEEPPVVINDEVRYYMSSKVPIYNRKNEIIGVIGISTDITHQKNIEKSLSVAREQAESASRAKSIFIANMSHDVRTPLAGVIGVSDMLEHEGETSKDREFGHTIHVSAERLLQLLDDILEVVSADELHESTLKLNTFNLQARLTFIKDLMISSTQQHHIDLTFNINENVPEHIVSDRVKVDRILLNLISNALKFTPSGTISIAVNALNKTEDEAILEFKISDTGIGIPNDQLDKIFDRFYRIDPSYHNKYKGHGIGLFIVRKYVDLLAGKITVKSEMGKGTTFTVILPIKIGVASDISKPEEIMDGEYFLERDSQIKSSEALPAVLPSEVPLRGKKSTIKVLVVEDDSIARRVVKSMLTRAGFEVDDVEDAEQGFWCVMKSAYDFILTDIGLPGMSGSEFTVVIRAWEKATHHKAIPIIGLTAHGKNQQAVKEAGMDMVFSKPLDEQKLRAINDHLFAISQPAKESTSLETTPPGLGYDLPETEEALFELDIYPLLDEKEGIETIGDTAFFKEILTMLIDQTLPEELPLLIEAHNKGDWERVQSIAHKLKGGAMYCGTKKLRYACQYTERYRLAGHSKLLEPLYNQLIAVITDTVDYLKKWLMQKSA